MGCQEVREELELYAIGALDAGARELVDRHAESCAECREILERATLQVAQLGFAAPVHNAPPELFGRLRREIAAEDRANRRPFAPLRFVRPTEAPAPVSAGDQQRRVRSGRPAPSPWILFRGVAACMAVVALLGLGAWNIDLQMQMHRVLSRSQYLEHRLAEMDAQRDAMMLLVSDGTQRFAMESADTSSQAKGAVIWNPDQRKCSVLASGLPPAPADQAYHVWLMGGNHSWDEGELAASANGAAEKTIDLSRYSQQSNYQLVVSRQPRQSAGGEWQPVLRAWVGD